MAREKNGPCDAESTTRGAEECLSRESKLTDSNFAAYTGAIRAILALTARRMFPGPRAHRLTEEELVKEFDILKAAWQQYRDIIPKTPYDQFKGGTLAPVFDGECTQQIVPSHMLELNQIYGGAIPL